ncbi:DNA polymerase III subunit delta [Legionella sp. km772]|uniref:DNA polymerase III subunit delta n=1 Tax=Legionella sp. km772 TaxID=2498111 RepID=UPI000F8E26F5|nr:DNA polymerase III subunit delta [Legionella sp. km772]RUR09594.1 DNA polymerase III subunit delta [Legionella sp. km772]
MQIKHNYLLQHLQKKSFALYWLAGQDPYLLEESLKIIKNHIKNQYTCDEKIISIQNPADWLAIPEEANNYSLFSDYTLLTIFYDKKTLDSTGKKIINEYLKNINSRCFLIIRTPHIPTKQLQWLTPLNDALLIVHYALNTEAMSQWIKEQLKKHSLSYEANVPALIQQYTQGNMLACAQVIEKISLSFSTPGHVSSKEALEHVFNQCEHNLFELVDACLLGQADKSIQILRHTAENKTEPTLILWMLAQEIRLILQLNYLMKQSIDFKTACAQLKIWPQRYGLFQHALKRLSSDFLRELLRYSLYIDEQIKSNLNTQTWNSLERVILSLCSGQGELCTL